ncbi:hypothetical protein TSAR_000765 [Trichomalopsis sarcophagae]|uniref:Uncharacterized protein n=1 Tax=Trichomalopsis sarcophagae TaxID=543379 RepID=A0A232EJA5_9HYME|nr:hypothetical protein TSAR_000765 [Trichomalopsis sarcophagae]
MRALEKSLEPLKEVPRLMNRVVVVEDDIAKLKAEQGDIKTKLDQLLSNGDGPPSSSSAVPEQYTVTIQQLREANVRIQVTGKDFIRIGHHRSFSETTSLRHLAFAALKPLDAQLAERDILSVRPLGSGRGARNETNETDGRPNAGTGASSSSIPLTASLSRTLMNSLVPVEIKLRKLHTKQLSDELLCKAQVPLPLPDSFININECLPPDVYHHRHKECCKEA